MKLVIDIPKEFEDDFKHDRFKDCFNRLEADLENSILCGNYEKETFEMLKNSLKNATVI